MSGDEAARAWSPAEFEKRLRRIGEERYHHRHPFNLRMHAGDLGRDEIRTWVCNRYYYQTRIPIKDSLILAKARDPGFRREWVQRLHDHDGASASEGGLELWLALAEAVGLERAAVESLEHVLPGVREACDDYVRFVESHDLLESVAASLTELFAGDIMVERIAAFEKHYAWVDSAGLRYFRKRTQQAPRDATWGLDFVLREARARQDQELCTAALQGKCEILWRLLDAVEAAQRRPLLARSAQLRIDPVGDQTLVVLPERAVKLNESGREILALCDGERTAATIALELRRRHPEVEQLESDVHEFLTQMRRLGVLASPT
ncbi:MAG: pyrroloquinoline-quinone synthase PqqC [Myxococcota bacterium]